MPADAVPGSTLSEDTEAEVVLQDGTWVWCQVIGQRKDRQGRWYVGIRWYASPSIGGREGWFLFDHRYIRRPKQELLHQPQHSALGRCSVAVQLTQASGGGSSCLDCLGVLISCSTWRHNNVAFNAAGGRMGGGMFRARSFGGFPGRAGRWGRRCAGRSPMPAAGAMQPGRGCRPAGGFGRVLPERALAPGAR